MRWSPVGSHRVQELNVSAHVEHAPDADQHLSLIVGERYPFGVEEAQRHGALQMSENATSRWRWLCPCWTHPDVAVR